MVMYLVWGREEEESVQELDRKCGGPVLNIQVHAGQKLYHIFDVFPIVERGKGFPVFIFLKE